MQTIKIEREKKSHKLNNVLHGGERRGKKIISMILNELREKNFKKPHKVIALFLNEIGKTNGKRKLKMLSIIRLRLFVSISLFVWNFFL